MQTQTSNTLHNAIMEAGGKDRLPMLAPGNYVQWKSRIKRYIDTKPNHELIHYCLKNPPYNYTWADKDVPVAEGSTKTTTGRYMENYKNVSQDIRDQLNAEAEAEFGKFTSRDGESLESYYLRFYKMMNELVRNQCDVTNHQVNVQFLLQLQPEWQRFVTLVKQSQELKTVSYHKLYDILKQQQNEVNEIRAERLARTTNPLAFVAQQQPVYHPQNHPTHYTQNSSTRSQQAATRNRGKAIVNSPPPIYDQEPSTARETIGTPVVQKSRIQCYNCKEFRHVARECQKPKRGKDAAYHKEKMLLCKQEEAGFQLNAEQADWRDDTDDESDDQELEAHYMYMAQIQEVTPDATDNSGPIFNTEPLQKVPNNDHYNMFAIESEPPEQSKSVNDTYPIEKDEHNVIINSLDMSYDREKIDQDDDDDLNNERDLLASLIEKLKCEIDDSKNRNKSLKTSNKKDLKKFQAKLDRHNDVKYASKVEIDYAKAKGDLMSYKMEFKKSSNKYTQKINDLNQMILEMKKELLAHQETISIMTQQKEAQIKFHKTREDKELDKVIALENKVNVLVNIVYKTGQSVQTMNMLNSKCRTSFAKPKFHKKARRANPHLINADLEKFHLCLKEEMVVDLRYFNSLKLELQEKGIAISELKKLIEKLKGKSVDTKFEKSSVIRQPNAFKSQKPSILGKPTIFSDSLENKDFSKLKSVTKNNVLNDFSKPVTSQILPPNKKLILKNTNVFAPGMYKLHTEPTQTRTTQLPYDFRKTNKRVSFSTGVIPPTSVSRPQLKSNRMEDRVMLNNSQGKKQEVEDHRRNVKLSKNKTFVTACNDSLNAKTLNVNFVCATCGECVLNVKHDMCILHSRNGVNSRTKMPMAVPISTRKPKRVINQSDAKPFRRIVASESINQKPRHTTRKLYEHVSKACSWWYPKFTPPGYKWTPKSQIGNLVEIILFIIDSGCSKHMTGNLKLLTNFVKKFLGSVKFGNDQIAPILDYEDLVQGAVTIKRVYYVEEQNHNLFSIGSRGTDLYSITLQNTTSLNPICLMVKATSSQAWLWHRRLSHLNFDTINLLSKNDIVIGLPKDGENLDKMKEKGNACIFVGYSTLSRAYRVFNKRTRVIVETIHVNFDELPQMASDHVSSDPVPQYRTVTTSNELDLLFSPMFDELLNGSTQVVSKSSAITTADAPNQYHPLEQVIGNPSQSVRTRCQLESDGEMCMFTLAVSRTKPKNIKEAMADSAWIESMQEELHQFDRLDDCTLMSSVEAVYVSLSACCAQVLWMRTQLTDYGFHFDKIPMYCDSKAAIAISCNPVQHFHTKHINLADLFTKALPKERFKYLVRRLGMRCLTPEELEVLANESA
uniref:CCHC-type domain-containing protein n=1 Tax=Tanacetum cinerariifolium TaxID=118510 RepID=A0A6L2NQ68_TANCI|nr:hypothetical protein [Tanacetum cinerariifolium]